MDIIDNASTLEDLHREAALSMHRLNRNLVSAENVVIATSQLKRNAETLTQAARCAWIVRLMQRDGIGGCDERVTLYKDNGRS